MDKDLIHANLKEVREGYKDTVSVSESDFIESYGDNKARKFRGVKKTRADILGAVYSLLVTQTGDTYIFERKS